MSLLSYNWHQAQVCMSLARATDDPGLKKRYENLALDFLEKSDFGAQGVSRGAAISKDGPDSGDASTSD